MTDKPASETLTKNALEAGQDARDEAKKVIEDGFADRGHKILKGLRLLDSCVVNLERALQAAEQRIKLLSECLVVAQNMGQGFQHKYEQAERQLAEAKRNGCGL